jgi:hypothetical protein
MRATQRSVDCVAKRALFGAASGMVGTLAIWLAQSATKKWVPQASEPMRLEPGEFIVTRAHKIAPASAWKLMPHSAEKASAVGLSFFYGASFGALYSLIRPRGGSTLLDGLILGTVCWATGYLGWLPATGLLPPIWKHKPAQVAGPIVQHAVYGAAAVGAYDWMIEHA